MADTRVHVRHLNSFPRSAICRISIPSKLKPTPNSAGSATMSTRPCRQPAETAANLDAWQGLHLKPLFFEGIVRPPHQVAQAFAARCRHHFEKVVKLPDHAVSATSAAVGLLTGV